MRPLASFDLAGPQSWLRLLLFCLSVFLPAPLFAQNTDILTGRVLSDNRQPVAGARVVAMSIETEITRSVLTDRNGRYMINFPDGGGRYILRVSFIGMQESVQTVVRDGEEELLLTNITMASQAIQLQPLEVTATRPPPGRGQTGEQSTELPQDILNRLPLPDLDPNTLALLAAGVVGTQLDSLSGRMGFSVAGMSDLLNQIVLDGMILGDGGLQVPEEGIRRTQVTTSTFDASRGGFAGGQVSMSSARGNNRTAGSISYQFDDDGMQWRSSPTTLGFTRHNLGGSIGGPLVRNRLFYNASFQATRNTNHRFSLSVTDPQAEERSGVALDSIGRFLDILGNQYGIATGNSTGKYDQFQDNIRLQSRVDWNIFQRQGQSQTLTASFNYSLNNQDSTRIGVTDITDHGGEQDQNSRAGSLSLNSRFGGNWTNALRASYNENWNDALPYIVMPEGRVRVTSDFEDGTRGTRTLVFGGNRSLPSESYSRDLQLSNDLSFLLPVGDQLHRLKVGGSLQRSRSINRSTNNIFGSFTYNSLADFQANRPERFDRSLSERRTNTGTLNAGVYIGDTWRISQPLEVTLGLRWDRTELDQKPAYNPRVEQVFGRRNDIDPIATGWSPRVGFNYRIASGTPGQPAKTLSGGVGVFAGRAQTNVFSNAVRQTGLPNAEQSLSCIGVATPIPDWDLYATDPDVIPFTCADGQPGQPPIFSSRGPTVTLINPDQSMPSSLRLDLGYRTRLPFNLNTSIRYTYSHGFGLWGYRDLNLNEAVQFTLPDGRPVFARPSAISPGGSVSLAGSRLHSEFSNVNDVVANRASDAHQMTLQVNGFLPGRITTSVNYTLGFARDNGGASLGLPQTAGNPNVPEWGISGNDRRHTLNLTLSHAITPELEVTAITQLSSGSPFTPVINSDINGDGSRNDRAFVPDPRASSDTALANAMTRMMALVPGRIENCIESQLGRVVERNSCRNGWTQSLNLRASFRPNLPQLGRRVTLSLDARNVLTGLDQLVNGIDNMKGWGEARSAESSLLEVRGFDANTNNFIYQVNEAFGQTRRGSASRPFQLTLSGRVAIGGQAFQNNRGFGPPIAIGAGVAGPGFALGEGPGGGGRGGDGPGGGIGDLGALLRAGPNANLDSVVAVVLPNPTVTVLALKDSLKLTEPQIQKVTALSIELQQQLDTRRATVSRLAKELDLQTLAARIQQNAQQNGNNGGNNGGRDFGGGRGGRGGGGGGRGGLQGLNIDPQVLQRIQLEVTPTIEGARRETTQTMAQVQRELTSEQWQKLPARIRGGQGGRGGGGFNAVGMLDRMLANPIPVLLQLKDTLKLTAEQVTKIQEISAGVQEKLSAHRAELGRRFDNVQGDQQGRLFQQMQPQIQAARNEVTEALKAIEKILTPEQWQQVPERIRNPFQTTPQQNRR
ncbi:MAG: TonB-dependent receptor domain-containing protein [Longimicrobiales bacterium]